MSAGHVLLDGLLPDVVARVDADLRGLFADAKHKEELEAGDNSGAVGASVQFDPRSAAIPVPAPSQEAVAKQQQQPKAISLHKQEHRSKGRVGLPVYKDFFSTAPIKWALVTLTFVASFALSVMTQMYVAAIATGDGSLLVYALLTLSNSVSLIVKLVLMFVQAIVSASSFHSMLLRVICRLTKLSVDTNPSGMFIARFTGDIDTIDSKMAVALEVFARKIFDLVQLVVLGSLSTYGVFAVVTLGIGVGAFFLGRYSSKSSIELTRSISITRGPVQTRIVEVAHAISTIRAFQQQQRWKDVVKQEVWTLTSCHVISIAVRRWLNIRLSVLGGFGVWSLAFFALFFHSESTAFVALGLAFSLELRQQVGWPVFGVWLVGWVGLGVVGLCLDLLSRLLSCHHSVSALGTTHLISVTHTHTHTHTHSST